MSIRYDLLFGMQVFAGFAHQRIRKTECSNLQLFEASHHQIESNSFIRSNAFTRLNSLSFQIFRHSRSVQLMNLAGRATRRGMPQQCRADSASRVACCMVPRLQRLVMYRPASESGGCRCNVPVHGVPVRVQRFQRVSHLSGSVAHVVVSGIPVYVVTRI